MDFRARPTTRDKKILSHCFENFSCKICNNILIQCMTLSCGHKYCSYCLDMLGGVSRQCPQCALPITYATPDNSTEQEIDKLVHSCSEHVRKSYAAALDSRFQKNLDRSKNHNDTRQKNYKHQSEDIKFTRIPDEICPGLDLTTDHCVAKALKSARMPSSYSHSCRSGRTNNAYSPSHTPRRGANLHSKQNNTCPQRNEIDISKVDSLFGIYDHVINLDNEPSKDMAGGDFAREEEIPNLQTQNFGFEIAGLKNFSQRSEIQLESLIRETEDIVRLDNHVQSWTNKMKDVLTGKCDQEKFGLTEDFENKDAHSVDDELWKASSKLLARLRGMQQQRQTMTSAQTYLGSCIPTLTPPPRSEKLSLDEISDDSDIEEYNSSLETLNDNLLPPQCGQLTEGKSKGLSSSNHHETQQIANSNNSSKCGTETRLPQKKKDGKMSSSKSDALNSIEESGSAYMKENIEFITQVRKYKDALMKIQNHEVETAEEIKQLLPNASYALDDTRYGSQPFTKYTSTQTPRKGTHLSQLKSARSSRLPSVNATPRRPQTASYDEMPQLKTASIKQPKHHRMNLYTSR